MKKLNCLLIAIKQIKFQVDRLVVEGQFMIEILLSKLLRKVDKVIAKDILWKLFRVDYCGDNYSDSCPK